VRDVTSVFLFILTDLINVTDSSEYLRFHTYEHTKNQVIVSNKPSPTYEWTECLETSFYTQAIIYKIKMYLQTTIHFANYQRGSTLVHLYYIRCSNLNYTYLTADDIIKTVFTPVTVSPCDMNFALALPRELITDRRAKASFLCSITVTLALLTVSLRYGQSITIETYITQNKVVRTD